MLSGSLVFLLLFKTRSNHDGKSIDDLKPDDGERSDQSRATENDLFMTTELYVGNMPMSMTDDALRDLLSAHGAVTGMRFRLDRTKREPHRFAFVTMAEEEGAASAIFALNGREVEGCELQVKHSRQSGERPAIFSDTSGRKAQAHR